MIDPTLFPTPSGYRWRLRVEGGRVACPRLGDVDFERCLECPYLVRFEDQRALFVMCQGPHRADQPEMTA